MKDEVRVTRGSLLEVDHSNASILITNAAVTCKKSKFENNGLLQARNNEQMHAVTMREHRNGTFIIHAGNSYSFRPLRDTINHNFDTLSIISIKLSVTDLHSFTYLASSNA
jgi:transcription elongation factor